jgi:hypothetical protein
VKIQLFYPRFLKMLILDKNTRSPSMGVEPVFFWKKTFNLKLIFGPFLNHQIHNFRNDCVSICSSHQLIGQQHFLLQTLDLLYLIS